MHFTAFLSFSLLLLQVVTAQFKCKKHYDSTGCQCGVSTTSKRVYPWMVHLYLDDRSKECLGILINNYYVLASANCALPTREETIRRYRASFQHMENNQPDANISDIIIHPQYNIQGNVTDNELMLFKINREVDMNIRAPACLPLRRAVLPPTPRNLFTFQWQKDGKRRRAVKQISRKWCYMHMGFVNPETSVRSTHYICAGAVNLKICGTTGNPLMLIGNDKYILYGITSNSQILSACKYHKVVLFTRVSAYVDWIVDSTKDAKYCKEYTD